MKVAEGSEEDFGNCAKRFNECLTNMWIDSGFMDLVHSRVQAKDLKEMNYLGTRKRYFQPLIKLTVLAESDGKTSTKRDSLSMECLNNTDTNQLMEMIDSSDTNLTTTQTFQYIGNFVLYIMEVCLGLSS